MLLGLYIFLDDEFDDAIYADPKDPGDLDDGLWEAACQAVQDALDEESEPEGMKTVGEAWVAWRVLVRQGISFVTMVSDDVRSQDVERYLAAVARRYMDEVDDARNPERDGIADVIVDVIPPWEDEEDD